MQTMSMPTQSMPTATPLRIAKIKDHIGAKVTGIDLTQPVDATTRQRLYRALVDNVALVIRDQHFTTQQYLDAAALFGEPMANEMETKKLSDVPLVSHVDSLKRTKDGKRVYNGATWHCDHTNQPVPPKFTALYAVALPDSGGGTSIANARAGYAALPDDVKKRIDGLQTVNVIVGSAAKVFDGDRLKWQQESGRAPVIHPLVPTNPDTGAKSIYFHPSKTENIVGMSPEASQALLDELVERTVTPEFIYTHPWRLGDMLIWDNRAAMHRANFDYDPAQHRLLYKIIVKGDRPS